MKIAVIVGLLGALAFVSDRLVRTENQRYALLVGMCQKEGVELPLGLEWDCLATVQTRTSWAWQLYYGLTATMPPVPLFAE